MNLCTVAAPLMSLGTNLRKRVLETGLFLTYMLALSRTMN